MNHLLYDLDFFLEAIFLGFNVETTLKNFEFFEAFSTLYEIEYPGFMSVLEPLRKFFAAVVACCLFLYVPTVMTNFLLTI